MAIQISITGLTPQQQQDIGNAFDNIGGRAEAGLTKAEWVEKQLINFMKNVVKGWKRKAHEDALSAEQAQVESDFI